jgi:peptidoglycan/xylan/chitin deacetylase (PgdA/CDA1 family)
MLTAVLCAAFGPMFAEPVPPAQGHVYVVLWFDTEDYILPQSDDSAKRIADMLTGLGVRATFKVVGEKGRTLERRGRKDVIEALSRHEIGFHANTHSQHPTPSEYESQLDWEQGAEEFTRRERPGFEDLRRIFGRAPTCYGQPGSSWVPQAFPALKSWGVKVYLDDAPHVGIDRKPFWYGGLLNVFNIKAGANLRPNEDWSNLDQAKANFKDSYRELLDEGGGVASIYFHPCEFIHQYFWDMNFAKGANPPPDQWKRPGLQTPEQIERNYNYLKQLVVYIKSFPQVRFITASEALTVMPDRSQGRSFSASELSDIAAQVTPDVSFQVRGDYALTASEIFELLNGYLVHSLRKEGGAPMRLNVTPYGPDPIRSELTANVDVTWSQFSRTAPDVESFLEKTGQIPSVVWLGSSAVPPESYLAALAAVARKLLAKQAPPQTVSVPPAHLAAGKYVADDSPDLWQWPIFPTGFDAPHMMTLAKAQAWTLKPAIIHPNDTTAEGSIRRSGTVRSGL